MADLSKDQLRRLAAMGAQARLEELRGEEAAIRQAFPELGRKASSGAVTEAAPPAAKRSRMSPAARRAVSERMKRYWAERRKAKAAKK